MATAKAQTTEVLVPEIRTVIVLELTQDEAAALATVTGRVGGDPKKSQRKHFDAIRAALISTGCVGDLYVATGTIQFVDYK
jgi:hypothetical protein